MKKIELISYIKNQIKREDSTSRYHEKVIEMAVEKEMSAMYNEIFMFNPYLLDKYVKRYGDTTPISVSYDSGRGVYYSTLPAGIIHLPCYSSGVRRIYSKITGQIFVPMGEREFDMIYDTDLAYISSKVGYVVRLNGRVEYWGITSAIRNAGVIMDLLVRFSEYDDEDWVAIPEIPGADDLIKRVLTKLLIIPPADLKDDNSSGIEIKEKETK